MTQQQVVTFLVHHSPWTPKEAAKALRFLGKVGQKDVQKIVSMACQGHSWRSVVQDMRPQTDNRRP